MQIIELRRREKQKIKLKKTTEIIVILIKRGDNAYAINITILTAISTANDDGD